MPNDKHEIALSLNKRLESLIYDINNQYKDDPELPEVIRQLERASKYLTDQLLKTFDDENNKI